MVILSTNVAICPNTPNKYPNFNVYCLPC